MTDYTGQDMVWGWPGISRCSAHHPGDREAMSESNLVPAAPASPNPLRAAAAEALLSGALVLADVQRDPNWKEQITKESEQRFRKALEALAGALG